MSDLVSKSPSVARTKLFVIAVRKPEDVECFITDWGMGYQSTPYLRQAFMMSEADAKRVVKYLEAMKRQMSKSTRALESERTRWASMEFSMRRVYAQPLAFYDHRSSQAAPDICDDCGKQFINEAALKADDDFCWQYESKVLRDTAAFNIDKQD